MANELSMADAVARLGAARETPAAGSEQTTEAREQTADAGAPREQESPARPEEGSAADDRQPPGEEETTEGADDAADDGPPPIDAPRSWTKAEKEAFRTLPREHQQAIVERERERETYYRKGHDEAAQKLKAAEAREQAAEQARAQYEQALPNLLAQVSAQFNTEFQDIQGWDDVQQMQEQDPLRYQRWQLARERWSALNQEAAQASQRQAQDTQARYAAWEKAELEKFLSAAPEYADPAKRQQLAAEVNAVLESVGFSGDELAALWNGRPVYAQDSRFKMLLRDAMRWRAAEKARSEARAKPVPPVQKPGVSVSRAERAGADIQNLRERLAKSGSQEDAVALLRARRAASSR